VVVPIVEAVTKEALGGLLSQRTVIVGIGNDMRGDDAFGPMVVERLRGRVWADLIDAGVSPENCLGKLSALKPRVVLLVDAVDFDCAPGDMVLLDPAKLETTSFGTHASSLALLEQFLSTEGVTRIALLAVQPKNWQFGDAVSDEVAAAVEKVIGLIEEADRGSAAGGQ